MLCADLPGWADNVQILYSTRTSGASKPPYASLNFAQHVGDDPGVVRSNRRELARCLPPAVRIGWLNQVHGTQVVEAARAVADPVEADALWTDAENLACAIMTADCLPVLLADRGGQAVAAVHAGWRGLAAGVIQSTVASMPVAAESLCAWLGPAIGRASFEVGGEVREAFLSTLGLRAESCFEVPAGRPDRYLADLRGLAKLVLSDLNISCVVGDDSCTFTDAERFFSYRRDGVTGRMVSLILRTPPQSRSF